MSIKSQGLVVMLLAAAMLAFPAAASATDFSEKLVGNWKDTQGRKYRFEYHNKKLWLVMYLPKQVVTYIGSFRRIIAKKPGKLLTSPSSIGALKDNMPPKVLKALVAEKLNFEVVLKAKMVPRLNLIYGEHDTYTSMEPSQDEVEAEFWTYDIKYDSNYKITHRKKKLYRTTTLKRTDRLCGPDVTSHIQATMDHLYEKMSDFARISKDTFDGLCQSLTALKEGVNAWDIIEFGPASLAKEGATHWAKHCARPTNPCATTVVFGGMCVNYQELNYIEWGVITALCEKRSRRGFIADSERLHRLWTSNEKIRGRQNVYTKFGRYFVDFRDRHPGVITIGPFSGFKVYVKEAQKGNFSRPDLWPSKDDLKYWPNKDAASCKMQCKMTPAEQKKWNNKKFIWHWGSFYKGPK